VRYVGHYFLGCAANGTYTVCMTHWDSWLERATNGASARAIAAALGVSNSTVSNWARNEVIPAEGAVAIARAYDASPVAALIAAGYLTDDDLAGFEVITALRLATRLQLVEELFRREIDGTESTKGGQVEVRPLPARG
jgi:transcriptional regulator with XRE-family HTH domain